MSNLMGDGEGTSGQQRQEGQHSTKEEEKN